jgi:prepilin-type N-terminal cleavage/methylation domain-containing protein
MTPSPSKHRNPNGFSLIEIIITLLVAALLGTVLIQYMSTSLTKSAEPVIMIQKGYALNHVMESMTADYKKLLLTDNDPLTTFKNYVENGNSTENSPYYGEPYGVQTGYITFNGGNEEQDLSGDNQILKVTITLNGQSLTALFTN